MRKMVSVLVAVVILALVGCTIKDEATIDNQRVISTKDDLRKSTEKFFYDGDTYTAELFVEMADSYEGILSGQWQQAYVFDLRNKEEYDKGHIIGSINLEFPFDLTEELIEKIPSDYFVYVIGETDAAAKEMALQIKEADKLLSAYVIEGGYEALLRVDGIDKYISVEPGAFTDFTRTEAASKFNAIVNSASD